MIVGKGAKSREFDPSDERERKELATAALGPSGNLRAPTLRVGDVFLVGFCEPAWKQFFA